MSNDLRSKVIRLAHQNPALRADLLPLLKEAGCEKLPEGGMRDNCEAKVEEGKEDSDKKAAKAPAKLKGKKLDALISKTYSVLGNGVTINMMDISKIYNDALKAYEGAGTPEEADKALEEALKTSIAKYKI